MDWMQHLSHRRDVLACDRNRLLFRLYFAFYGGH